MPETILGILIGPTHRRDAIHIAVAPVIAAEDLKPGDHIGFVQEPQNKTRRIVMDTTSSLVTSKEKVGKVKNPIGIVDPFLNAKVKAGERFYLCLYPQSVTGMRHEWQHPAFMDEVERQAYEDESEKAKSIKWLRDYAVRINVYDDPEAAYDRLINGLKNGNLFAHGSYLHSFSELDDPEDLKRHAENVLGIKIDWNNTIFSCSY